MNYEDLQATIFFIGFVLSLAPAWIFIVRDVHKEGVGKLSRMRRIFGAVIGLLGLASLWPLILVGFFFAVVGYIAYAKARDAWQWLMETD